MDTPGSTSERDGIGRRAFLVGAGAAAGALVARGLGVPRIVEPTSTPPAYAGTLRALGHSLSPLQRELLVFPADHPSLQIVNTISVLERPHLGTLLTPAQRALAADLYASMLSEQGRRDLAGTIAVEGRLDGCVLAIYGEPENGDARAVLSGGHLMLRGGGAGPGGAPLGGGVAYGHQIGNGRWRVSGNSFQHHGDAANRVYAALPPEARARAVLATPPHELVLQPLGAGAALPGVRTGELPEAARARVAALVETVLSPWPDSERANALAALDANGGVDALHVSFFESHGFYEDMQRVSELDPSERGRRGDPYWQVWRVEGPGSVFHFQGHPHVHAYVNVVRDPARAYVGESLGVTPSGVEGPALRRVIEGALRRATELPLAYAIDSVPGRFCPGEVTTGLAYALDPYRNHVVVATVATEALGAGLRARLEENGVALTPGARHRVATVDYAAGEVKLVGEPERVERSPLLLRDALVAHLRAGGLADASA